MTEGTSASRRFSSCRRRRCRSRRSCRTRRRAHRFFRPGSSGRRRTSPSTPRHGPWPSWSGRRRGRRGTLALARAGPAWGSCSSSHEVRQTIAVTDHRGAGGGEEAWARSVKRRTPAVIFGASSPARDRRADSKPFGSWPQQLGRAVDGAIGLGHARSASAIVISRGQMRSTRIRRASPSSLSSQTGRTRRSIVVGMVRLLAVAGAGCLRRLCGHVAPTQA